MKDIVTGTIITLLIGGTAYTFSQSDVIQNFAEDTGLTQEQAEQYINEIPENELGSWGEIGSDFVGEGQTWLSIADEIDCVNYDYEWESTILSCSEGKTQFNTLSRNSNSLGQAYTKLDSDSASEYDMSETIKLIDQMNDNYRFEIVAAVFDRPTIDEWIRTNSYNKALLKAALESN